MPAMHRILPALLLLATALSGCGDGAPKTSAEVVAFSEPVEEVTAEATQAPAAEIPKAGTRGHIAGIVVDEAIRPVENVSIRIPGLDFESRTRRDGSFAFADLRPGPYFLTANATGYYPAQVEVDVVEDRFVRVKFVLTSIAPPEPWHEIQKFDGYAEVTEPIVILGGPLLCNACDFEFYAGGEGFRGLTLEAATDAGATDFFHSLDAVDSSETYSSGSAPNPLHRILAAGDAIPAEATQYDLYLAPESFPVPQTAVDFEVFVTAWYNQEPPTDWSIVEGDT